MSHTPSRARRFFAHLMPWCVLTIFLATACSRDPEPGTAEATAQGERIMRQMSATLAGARTFSFSTIETLEVVEADGNKRAVTFTRNAIVRRPDGLAFELLGTGDPAARIAAYYDGATVSLRGDNGRVWAQTEVPGTLDEMLDDVAWRFALPVPIADVVYSSPYDAFVGPESQGGFVGRETIEGVECIELAYDDAFVGVRIWVAASGQVLPCRLRLVYKRVPEQPASQMTFTKWNLDLEVTDEMFAFDPPEDYTRIAFEEFVAAASSGQVPAPPAADETESDGSEP